MRFKTAHQLVHHDRNTLKIIEPFDLARVESPSVWNVNGTVCIDWVFLLSSVSSEPGDSELLARGCLYSVDLSTPVTKRTVLPPPYKFFFSKLEELQVNQERMRGRQNQKEKLLLDPPLGWSRTRTGTIHIPSRKKKSNRAVPPRPPPAAHGFPPPPARRDTGACPPDAPAPRRAARTGHPAAACPVARVTRRGVKPRRFFIPI